MKKENKLAEIIRKTAQKAAPKPHFWNWESVKARWEHLEENLKSAT